MNLYEYINFDAFDDLPDDYNPRKGESGIVNMLRSGISSFIGPCNVTKFEELSRDGSIITFRAFVDRENVEYVKGTLNTENMRCSFTPVYKKDERPEFKPTEGADPKLIISGDISHKLSHMFGQDVRVTKFLKLDKIGTKVKYVCKVNINIVDYAYGDLDTKTNEVSLYLHYLDVPYR